MRTILKTLKDITIEKQVYGGRGLARHEGQVIFVEDALEGDQLRVEISKNHKNFAEAKIVKILQPSPFRRTPACPYAQECGGCSWMNFADDKQIEWKKNFIESELRFLEPTVSIISDDKTRLGYRNRIQLRGRVHKDGSLSLGYFKKATHELIAITNCLIARNSIQTIIYDMLQIKLLPSTRELKFRVDLQEVRLEDQEKVTALFEWVDKSSPHERALTQALSSHSKIAWVGGRGAKKQSFRLETDENMQTSYLTQPGLFQQVNLELNALLRSQIQGFIKLHKISSVLDLYCGSGNLSMGLAYPELKSVVGFEISEDAIRVAHENVALNQNASTHSYQALSSFQGLAKFAKSVDCIICDPPRAGMKEVIPYLVQLAPQYLVYVSCNLSTLARDLKDLMGHFTVLKITGYDFFPQTFHVETVVFLEISQ